MKNSLFLILLVFVFPSNTYAQIDESIPLFEKNYIQLDPIYLDYQIVKADNTKYNENNEQLMTSRPSILFYFNIQDYILKPFLSLDPTLSNSAGSFSLGKLFEQFFEIGLYTLLNHTENSVGKNSTENGIVHSKFLIGPYFIIYPYVDNKNFLQIYTHVAYEYSHYQSITSGTTADVSEQKGVNFNISFLYSMQINEKFYYSPNINFTYFSTADFAGNNTTRNGFELQVIPVSFQVPL